MVQRNPPPPQKKPRKANKSVDSLMLDIFIYHVHIYLVTVLRIGLMTKKKNTLYILTTKDFLRCANLTFFSPDYLSLSLLCQLHNFIFLTTNKNIVAFLFVPTSVVKYGMSKHTCVLKPLVIASRVSWIINNLNVTNGSGSLIFPSQEFLIRGGSETLDYGRCGSLCIKFTFHN